MTAPSTPFGTPLPPAPRSLTSAIIVEPTIGFDLSRSALNIADGATPNSDNFIMREGRLTPRPMLSLLTDAANSAVPVSARMLGGLEVVSVAGARYILVNPASADGQVFWLNGTARTWQTSDYTSAFGVNTPPAPAQTDYTDWTQIFSDQAGENIAVGAFLNRQGLYCWAPESAVFSTLTGSPGARCVTAFDNYLLAANLEEAGETFIQRVRWCDRGSASSWTGGLSGFEDLLSAKGGINRMLPLDNRVAVFFDDEIWVGVPIDFPGVWRFTPLDSMKGCPYPWTATVTPRGILFMARNYQLYLLPAEGGGAVEIGRPLHRSIRDAIVQAPRAFGVYDGIRDMYQFYYSSGASGNLPHQAAFLHIDTGAWAPQSFASADANDIALTRGFQANIPASRASLWDEMAQTWNAMTVSWNDLLGLGNERQTVVLGSSAGTLFQLDSAATSDMAPGGQPVVSFWESKLLGEAWPGAQKTTLEVRADYTAPSASSLTVRTLQDQTFSTGTRLALPAVSGVSQGVAYAYTPSRYAALRVETEGQQGLALQRFHVTMRVGGR